MSDFNQARIALGLPIGSEMVSWRFMASLLDLHKPPVFGFIIRQGSLVDKSRNEIVKMFLEHQAQFTHLLFLDSDMIFLPDTMSKLFSHQKPLASGLCYTRVSPFSPCVFTQKQGVWQKILPEQLPKTPSLVEGAGTGCLLVARSVFEQLTFPWFAIEWNGNHQRGEDLYFMQKCAQAKLEVMLDPTVKTGHLTSAVVEDAGQMSGAHVRLL